MDSVMPGPQAAESADLSSRTVTTLVILTLVISFIGAWMNVNHAVTIAPPPVQEGTSSQTATSHVSFSIVPPDRDSATGLVAFRLQPPGG